MRQQRKNMGDLKRQEATFQAVSLRPKEVMTLPVMWVLYKFNTAHGYLFKIQSSIMCPRRSSGKLIRYQDNYAATPAARSVQNRLDGKY